MLIVSTSCFKGYGLHKIFKLVSLSGYDGLNLDLSPVDFDTENILYIKELSQTFKVPVVSISAYERKMDNNTVDFIIQMARELGSKSINFYPPHRLDKDNSWFSNYLPKIKEKNPDLNINIMNVEPKTFLFFIPEYKDATLSTIKKITNETALVVSNVDPSSGIDLLKTFSLLGNSIKNVYLSDKSGNKQDMFLGKGDMPLRDLLGKLNDNGYSGLFTLKINPKEILAGKDDQVLVKLLEAKEFFLKHFKI